MIDIAFLICYIILVTNKRRLNMFLGDVLEVRSGLVVSRKKAKSILPGMPKLWSKLSAAKISGVLSLSCL